MRKKEKGAAPLIGLIILAILAVLVSAGAYYFLKAAGKLPSVVSVPQPTNFVEEEELPISDSDEIEDIEKELDSTVVGSIEEDLDELDAEASSL
jgi:hypothetical protein